MDVSSLLGNSYEIGKSRFGSREERDLHMTVVSEYRALLCSCPVGFCQLLPTFNWLRYSMLHVYITKESRLQYSHFESKILNYQAESWINIAKGS